MNIGKLTRMLVNEVARDSGVTVSNPKEVGMIYLDFIQRYKESNPIPEDHSKIDEYYVKSGIGFLKYMRTIYRANKK